MSACPSAFLSPFPPAGVRARRCAVLPEAAHGVEGVVQESSGGWTGGCVAVVLAVAGGVGVSKRVVVWQWWVGEGVEEVVSG